MGHCKFYTDNKVCVNLDAMKKFNPDWVPPSVKRDGLRVLGMCKNCEFQEKATNGKSQNRNPEISELISWSEGEERQFRLF